MSNDSSNDNATWLSNSTVKESDPFTAEYVRFNYIMVGVSFGLLLVIIIIAKVLCIYNKEPYYDKVDLSTALHLKDDEMGAPNYVRGAPNGGQLDYGPSHVPGEISDDDDQEEGRNDGYHKPAQSGATVWHTPPLPLNGGAHPQLRSVLPSSPSMSSDTVRNTPAPPTFTSRTSSGGLPPTRHDSDPETEAGRLLRHLEAVMSDECDRRSPGGAESASSRIRLTCRSFAWPVCEASRSAPAGDSSHFLVDIT